jgi:hypothetical protein
MDCWHRELEHSTTEDQILRNAKDYLHLWGRGIGSLTLGWREVRIDTAADLERWKPGSRSPLEHPQHRTQCLGARTARQLPVARRQSPREIRKVRLHFRYALKM